MNCKLFFPLALAFIFILNGCNHQTEKKPEKDSGEKSALQNQQKKTASLDTLVQNQENKVVPIDTAAYSKKLHAIANGDTTGLWPHQVRS